MRTQEQKDALNREYENKMAKKEIKRWIKSVYNSYRAVKFCIKNKEWKILSGETDMLLGSSSALNAYAQVLSGQRKFNEV